MAQKLIKVLQADKELFTGAPEKMVEKLPLECQRGNLWKSTEAACGGAPETYLKWVCPPPWPLPEESEEKRAHQNQEEKSLPPGVLQQPFQNSLLTKPIASCHQVKRNVYRVQL